jgi:hypothetical protein
MKFRGGEFSTGTMRNFQPELTRTSRVLLRRPLPADILKSPLPTLRPVEVSLSL